MNSASSTNFLNAKRRRIYQGPSGGFYVMKDGKKVYRPTAAFRQVGNGAATKVTAKNANVPAAIKRAVRKNAGVKRGSTGPREGTAERRAAAMFKTPKARKVRSNKGVKRGPREGTAERRAAAMFKTPVARKAKTPQSLQARLKAGLSPLEGQMNRLFFNTINKMVPRKTRKNKGVMRGPREGTAERRAAAMFNMPKRTTRTPKRLTSPAMEASFFRKINAMVPYKPRKATGPREGTAERRAAAMFNKPKRTTRKPKSMSPSAMESSFYRKYLSPKVRKTRKNKGVRRGPRKSKNVLNVIVVTPNRK